MDQVLLYRTWHRRFLAAGQYHLSVELIGCSSGPLTPSTSTLPCVVHNPPSCPAPRPLGELVRALESFYEPHAHAPPPKHRSTHNTQIHTTHTTHTSTRHATHTTHKYTQHNTTPPPTHTHHAGPMIAQSHKRTTNRCIGFP